MKITTFEIKFDNHQGVFQAGGLVSGHVHLTLAKPLKMRSLKVYFSGNGKSYWDVRKGKHTTKYRARETYLNHFMTLYGSANDGSSREHPAGSHVYPFAFQLQSTVPSSFEGSRGYVRYFCKATIDRPWKFDSHNLRAFTVIHQMDLNLYPNCTMPLHMEKQQEIEGCCCNEGTVAVSVDVNKSGFVPGEPLVYDLKIDNKSDHTVGLMHLLLEQVVNYTGYSDSMWSSGQPKYHEKKQSFNLFSANVNVQKNNIGGVVNYTGYSDSMWSSGHPKYHEKKQSFNLFSANVNVQKNNVGRINRATLVPSLPPTHLEGCNIIDIKYFVKLKLPAGWSSLKMEREVMVGTIPLRESWPQPPTAPNQPPQQPTLEQPAVEPTAPPSYEEVTAPPPSYAECAFGRQDIRDENHDEHTSGDTNWAPAYPYYDWSRHSNMLFGGEAPGIARPNPPEYDQI